MHRSFFAIALSLAVAGSGQAADWPQLLGPSRDGHSNEVGLQWNWPASGPTIAWKKDLGTGWAGPIAISGKLVMFHRVDDEEVVACLDPTSGKEIWTFKYATKYRDQFDFDNGPRATPTAAEGKIFTLGANGDLHALDLGSGKKLWSRNILADYGPPKGFFGVASSPLFLDGKLIANVGAKGAGVVAFDAATGKELWRATDDQASYSSPTAGEIEGKPTAIFLTREGLKALDPVNGKVRYEFPWRPRINESVNAATPLVWNDEVFLTVSYATGAALVKLKGGEATDLWSNDKSLSCQYNTPVRVGDFLYGVHGRADVGTAQLRCIEWKTGAVRWSEPKFGVASVLAVDGGLLALTESGDLVRFDASAEKYRERARGSILSRPTRAAPALAYGLFFARDGSKLVCVKLKKE